MRKSTNGFPQGRQAGEFGAVQTHAELRQLPKMPPRVSASRMIADALRRAIVEGSLKPGEPLRQDAVAARFSVSAIPVREALRQLESEGWVCSETNKGATVSPLLAAGAREIYEIRAALESLALGLALPRHTEHTLESAAALLAAATGEADEALYVKRNQAFHLSLYEPCGRPHLIEMIANLHRRGERYLGLKLGLPSYKAQSDAEHRQLFAAVRARDGDTAQSLVTRHLLGTGEMLYRFLEARQAAGAAAPVKASGALRRKSSVITEPDQ